MSSFKKFKEVLLANSVSVDYKEAIEEWISHGEHFKMSNYCICEHEIINNYIVTNSLNNNQLTIGSCCIKRFGIKQEHYNSSRLNYLQLALSKAKDDRSKSFVNQMIDNLGKYEYFRISRKQIKWLEDISGVHYRW
jgi:hypothetical protein